MFDYQNVGRNACLFLAIRHLAMRLRRALCYVQSALVLDTKAAGDRESDYCAKQTTLGTDSTELQTDWSVLKRRCKGAVGGASDCSSARWPAARRGAGNPYGAASQFWKSNTCSKPSLCLWCAP